MREGAAVAHRGGSRGLQATSQLLTALTVRDLKLRYQGSFFGWAWTLARPLALGIVLYFALGKVLAAGITNYPQFLLVGLFPWFWFQSSVQQATNVFVGNGGLLKKVRFPRVVLPLSIVAGNTLQFLLAFPVILVFLLVAGIYPEWEWAVGLPLLVAVQLALTIGTAVFVASATVYFRDLEHITDVVLGLLFYATPLLYGVDRIPDRYEWIAWANPLAPLAEGWRGVLMEGELPQVELLVSGGMAAAALVLGFWLFYKVQDSFADVV
ncbi:MAG: ABC transporter permease [Dehalococcoidia bacterium]